MSIDGNSPVEAPFYVNSGPAANALAITPSDSTIFVDTTRAIWVGAAGNIRVDMVTAGTGITFANVPVGFFPVQVTRVYATGTTAASLIGVW